MQTRCWHISATYKVKWKGLDVNEAKIEVQQI